MNPIKFVAQADSGIPISDQIVSHFESLILSGGLPHDYRLPSGLELAREWGCGYVTVQKAFRRLAMKGLARRTPQKGTYINASNITRTIGILVGPPLKDACHAYHRILALGVENKITDCQLWPPGDVGRERGVGAGRWTVRVYDGLRSADDIERRSVSIDNLLSDIERNDFAGLVEIGFDSSLYDCFSEISQKPRAIAARTKESCVHQDSYDFTYSTTRALIQSGCREIVYFRNEGLSKFDDCNGIFDACSAYGLPLPDIRQIPFDFEKGKSEQLLEAVAHEQALSYFKEHKTPKNRLSTGVIVSDDVAALGIAIALLRLDPNQSDRVRFATVKNEGIEHYYAVPVIQYQIPITQKVDHLVGTLWRRMIGEPAQVKVFKGEILPVAFA